jgi:hypothetical protein
MSRNPEMFGRIVTTLNIAPEISFRLPDGFLQLMCGPKSEFKVWWVVELQSQVRVLTTGGSRMTRYCVIPDAYLRPIRNPGEGVSDETLQWLPVPSADEVTA